MRIAAVGDVHVGPEPEAAPWLAGGLSHVAEAADVLLLAGDLTRCGTVAEADRVAEGLAGVGVPVVAVLGNHDLHADRGDEVAGALRRAGVAVLDGDGLLVPLGGQILGVAGATGFGGGFVGACVSEFGEPTTKAFAREGASQAERLGAALQAVVHADVRVALLHYSPVRETLLGEEPEVYPFLGSYLLAEAIDCAGADLVVHGHAHRGTERGATPGGVRVRNVAQPVIRSAYHVFELHPAAAARERAAG